MAELKIKDFKPSEKGDYKFAQVKKGHRLYGEIREYPNKLKVYWAFRKPDEVFVKADAWAVDVETIKRLRSAMVPLIGVLVTNGDKYLTWAKYFQDEKDRNAENLDYSQHIGAGGKFGADQWYLPRSHFAKRLAPPESTLELMKIKGRR